MTKVITVELVRNGRRTGLRFERFILDYEQYQKEYQQAVTIITKYFKGEKVQDLENWKVEAMMRRDFNLN